MPEPDDPPELLLPLLLLDELLWSAPVASLGLLASTPASVIVSLPHAAISTAPADTNSGNHEDHWRNE
jgi:hypothetical protein